MVVSVQELRGRIHIAREGQIIFTHPRPTIVGLLFMCWLRQPLGEVTFNTAWSWLSYSIKTRRKPSVDVVSARRFD